MFTKPLTRAPRYILIKPMSLQPWFSSLINTTVLAIFPNLCLWRRSLCSNLGDIDPEKLYRATLTNLSFHAFSLKWLQISLGLFSKNRLEVYTRLIMVNISSSNFWCSVVISFIHFIPKVRKRDAEFASVNVKGVPLFNGSYTKGIPFLSKIVYKSGGGLDLRQSYSM